MSLSRRLELIQWASDHNSVIIENDYEHEINNYSEFIPSIYSLDPQQRTFFLGTFNRLLHPSIRVGYMVAPPQYIDAIEAFLRYLHRFVPYSKQLILSRFIEKNYIYSHISNLIEVAEKRRQFFCKTFEENFSGHYMLSDTGARSLHLLATLNERTPDRKLIQYFRNKGIVAHAYSKTFAGDDV
jgi:GntR family transcriptional regulator / MocR family aminotransferase